MRKSKYKKIYAGLIITTILLISFSPQMTSYFFLPINHKITVGDELRLPLVFPENIINNISLKLYDDNGFINSLDFSSKNKFHKSGSYKGKLSLFGFIPIKEIQVDVVPEVKVYPSGHSIGVVLSSQGVMVVGFSSIKDKMGKELNPAKEQGILIGDIISTINNKPVSSDKELAELINQFAQGNKPINMEIIRNKEIIKLTVKPIKCNDTGRYRIGLYVRDTAAGIGTLTFYEPVHGRYGALGHLISNTEINEQLEDGVGKIISATILKINYAKKGFPGEKVGNFSTKSNLSGIILRNTTFGIFGVLDKFPANTYYSEPIPVAYASQIKTGRAEILTVVEGDKIDKFEIEIEKVIPYYKQSGKGLVIKVTDSKLLNKTGGIVQGMSGSPIIQDGKLVGAVTHVFVQDPTRGYGILAEWMLEEIDLIPKERLLKLQSAS